ncbi:MAG: hypothetical protein EBZ48_06990 [Proteobacteria bacterium]|nr:hypothetical protein [Pseudomonadota bacterium]
MQRTVDLAATLALWGVLCVGLLVGGCAPKTPRMPPRPAYFTHEIIYRGETLSVKQRLGLVFLQAFVSKN